MLARSALLLVALTSSAHAAAFDDLKGYLASCLRFEMGDPRAQQAGSPSAKVRFALERCGQEFARLEQADPRRARGDGGISPSTRAVILGVMGRGGAPSRPGDGYRAVRY